MPKSKVLEHYLVSLSTCLRASYSSGPGIGLPGRIFAGLLRERTEHGPRGGDLGAFPLAMLIDNYTFMLHGIKHRILFGSGADRQLQT